MAVLVAAVAGAVAVAAVGADVFDVKEAEAEAEVEDEDEAEAEDETEVEAEVEAETEAEADIDVAAGADPVVLPTRGTVTIVAELVAPVIWPPATVSTTSTLEVPDTTWTFCTTGRTATAPPDPDARVLMPLNVTREFCATQLRFAVFIFDSILFEVNGILKLVAACERSLGREFPSVTLLTAFEPPILEVVHAAVSWLAHVAPVNPLTQRQLQNPEEISFFPPFKQVTSAIQDAKVNTSWPPAPPGAKFTGGRFTTRSSMGTTIPAVMAAKMRMRTKMNAQIGIPQHLRRFLPSPWSLPTSNEDLLFGGESGTCCIARID